MDKFTYEGREYFCPPKDCNIAELQKFRSLDNSCGGHLTYPNCDEIRCGDCILFRHADDSNKSYVAWLLSICPIKSKPMVDNMEPVSEPVTPAPIPYKRERIGNNSDTRTKVFGGWVMDVGTTAVFIPDPKHEWVVC